MLYIIYIIFYPGLIKTIFRSIISFIFYSFATFHSLFLVFSELRVFTGLFNDAILTMFIYDIYHFTILV